MATHTDIVEWVEANVTTPTTYGRVAKALDTSPRAVGGAMRGSPDSFRKAHLVLRADWTVNPEFTGDGRGPEYAAARLRADGFEVVQLPSGTFRLANPPTT